MNKDGSNLPPIVPCGCGAECIYELYEDENENGNRVNDYGLCWGKVTVVDEITYEDGDYSWVHVCEGHDGVYFGGEYIEPDVQG